MTRSASIVMIQAWWRGHSTRKKTMPKLRARILQERAARKIQKWLRGLPYRHQQLFKFMFVKDNPIRNKKCNSFVVSMEDYKEIIGGERGRLFPWHEWEWSINIMEGDMGLSLRSKRGRRGREYVWSGLFLREVFPGVDKEYMTKRLAPHLMKNSNYSSSLRPVDSAHLFHFNTKTTILHTSTIPYLQLTFSTPF